MTAHTKPHPAAIRVRLGDLSGVGSHHRCDPQPARGLAAGVDTVARCTLCPLPACGRVRCRGGAA